MTFLADQFACLQDLWRQLLEFRAIAEDAWRKRAELEAGEHP